MKVNIILLIAIIFTSCNGTSQQKAQSKTVDEDWNVAKVIIQEHSYNKQGLLDTTHRIENYYVNGQIGEVINFLVIRSYDTKSNLVSEKTFQVFKKKNELSEEKLFKYDEKNNLILETDKFENVVSTIIKTDYNSNNQKIQETTIQKSLEDIPKNWNLDSAVAHHNDKQAPHYDTSIIGFEYDIKGKLTKQFYKNSNKEIVETLTTLFSNRQKTLTFGISSNGDTTSICNYEKQGNLIAEIRHDKINPFSIDTSLYDGSKVIQTVFIDRKINFRRKETYKYDDKGNEIENISYK